MKELGGHIMSHYREQPFKVTENDRGGWVVDFEGTAVPVGSHSDAMLLADLPVELCKTISKDQKPDPDRIKLILAMCNEYHLDHRFGAVRQLRSWLKRTGC
jgi:hypothetical protein